MDGEKKNTERWDINFSRDRSVGSVRLAEG